MYMELFFFNDTATTEIYTLSLHDALPISRKRTCSKSSGLPATPPGRPGWMNPWRLRGNERASAADGNRRISGNRDGAGDRKSTRLNSSHANISYAVFCLKKKGTSPC